MMNTFKRVKILITLGLLANILYITPIWAEESSQYKLQGSANSNTLLEATRSGVIKDGSKLVATEDAKQFFQISALERNPDAVAFIKFNEKGMSALKRLPDSERVQVYKQVAESARSLGFKGSFLFMDSTNEQNKANIIGSISAGSLDYRPLKNPVTSGANPIEVRSQDAGYQSPAKPGSFQFGVK
jgi:hypothetical protein